MSNEGAAEDLASYWADAGMKRWFGKDPAFLGGFGSADDVSDLER